MSAEDNLLKLVEAEEPDDQDYLLQEQVGFILSAMSRSLPRISAI